MREKIVRAAEERFAHYGYDKTTIADIAGDLKISTAYVYKFFESKLAINEAVAVDVLTRVGASLHSAAQEGTATERLRAVYRTLLEESLRMFFDDRKMHEMVVVAIENEWCSVARHKERIVEVVRQVIRDGRASGEFETASDEAQTVAAVFATMVPFGNPHVLQQTIDRDLRRDADSVAELVIRGLRA
ncbi:MAG TPA: TetR/AcrR family transcriptional regulator [Sphingomonadaceae bacterium]|nr:TetR/AcrR family transcriptional regulator [Sphingomonadaceae bacterium]